MRVLIVSAWDPMSGVTTVHWLLARRLASTGPLLRLCVRRLASGHVVV